MPFVGELRPFQAEAFERMLDRQCMLIAYEMGLGKTVLSLAVTEHLLDTDQVISGLIIVPSSLKHQWRRSIDAFTDGARSIVIGGTPKQRARQYALARKGRFEYVILNYEQIVNDWAHVIKLRRDFIILDEATAIKSFTAKRSAYIKRLNSEWKFALSGQPIENKPEEVFSIMQWVDPTVLGRFDIFDSTFIVRDPWGKVKFYRSLPTLHARLSEAMARKTRHDPDVAPFMPKVGEETLTVPFDREGAKLYRQIVADLLAEIDAAAGKFGKGFDLWAHYHGDEEGAEAQGRIMSRLTCLRMLCDHPLLLRLSAERYGSQASTGIAAGSAYAFELLEQGLLDGVEDMKAPKLKATTALAEELLDANPDNKVVLFAFFKDALNLAQDATRKLTKSVLFTGDMNADQKDAAKQRFTYDPECRLFLSSDAGGYGLDLPNANYLISYDLPWSAGALDQRNARIIRLSSEFEAVTVLYVLMEGSVEERQLALLDQKRGIGSAIIDGKGVTSKGTFNMDLKGLGEFLRDNDV